MSDWYFAGTVGVDVGTMIVSDSLNFYKYKVNQDSDNIEECINLLEKEGYSVPWLGGDGDWNLFCNFSSTRSKFQDSILIYHGPEKEDVDSKYFLEFVDIKKEKVDSIKIESGKIAINDPVNAFYKDPSVLENSFVCPKGKGIYDIFDLYIIYNSINRKLDESFVGTLIELNPKQPLTKNKFYDGVSDAQQPIVYGSKSIRVHFNLLKNRLEYYFISDFSCNEIEENLANGFDGKMKYHLERGYDVTFCLPPLPFNAHKLEKNFVDGVNSFCKQNNREVIFEKRSKHYYIACTIKALPKGFAAISDAAKKL